MVSGGRVVAGVGLCVGALITACAAQADRAATSGSAVPHADRATSPAAAALGR